MEKTAEVKTCFAKRFKTTCIVSFSADATQSINRRGKYELLRFANYSYSKLSFNCKSLTETAILPNTGSGMQPYTSREPPR